MFPATDSTNRTWWRYPVTQSARCGIPTDQGISGDLCILWTGTVPVTSPAVLSGAVAVHRQGLETGGKFPGGQNPLCLDSPDDFSAKPGILAACLVPHRTFQGQLRSRGSASYTLSPNGSLAS